MKTFFNRLNLSGKLGKLAVPASGAFVIAMLTTVNGCSQSDRSTDAREEVITQNALEAEAAEATLAVKKQEPAKGKASADKGATAAKTAKVAKTEPVKKAANGKKEAVKPESAVKQVAKELSKEKPEATREPRKPAAVAGGTYVVQVGAFKMKENADKLKEKLAKAGYNVETQTVDHSKNGTLHLVRFQPTSNRAEAETLIEDLNSKQDRLIVEFRGENDSIFLMKRRLEEALIGID